MTPALIFWSFLCPDSLVQQLIADEIYAPAGGLFRSRSRMLPKRHRRVWLELRVPRLPSSSPVSTTPAPCSSLSSNRKARTSPRVRRGLARSGVVAAQQVGDADRHCGTRLVLHYHLPAFPGHSRRCAPERQTVC